MPAPQFPGRVISIGETDVPLVTTIQNALSARGYGPFNAGQYDEKMKSVVSTFQSQNVDADGQSLLIDGNVGRHTWGGLFEVERVVPQSASSPLMLQALAIASTQIGIMEVPEGSNRGPMVDQFLRAAGIDPTHGASEDRPWCMAFVFWCFREAAKSLTIPSPLPKTAGCVDHWNRAKNIPGAIRIQASSAFADPTLVKPGLIFILDFGGGHGHTGIVESLRPGGGLATVEGNTNNSGSRNGVGVFRLARRKLNDASLKGFVDYSGA